MEEVYSSKRDVTENFSLEELLDFARSGDLEVWLSENFYAGEARTIATAVDSKFNDAELKLLICKVFDLPFENLSASELEEISLTVAKKQRRELFLKKLPNDERKMELVETQSELVQALKNEAHLIYLYGGEFKIPLNRRGVTYIGCENAVIELDEEYNVDLDAAEIVLENLQVYLRHKINLQAAKSKNIKILDGSKETLTPNVSLKEIFHILRGRKAFEPPESFKARAENIRGAAVGETLLEDKNYNFSAAQFTFKPHWDFEYISVLKDFANGKTFSIKISPQDAESLYNNERKLQIFADFTYRDDALTILKLYFDTKTFGRIEIAVTLREENFPKITSAISSGGGLGYGLDIITDIQPKISDTNIITDIQPKIPDMAIPSTIGVLEYLKRRLT